MPFLKGKIGFTPLDVIGRNLPDASTITAKIVMHPYKPLGEKESSKISFITPMTTIPDEFEKPFENPIFRDFVLAGVVIEHRKVDMAVVRSRVKFEFDRAMKLFKVQGLSGLGGNKPDKKEIKSRIIEEELPKAPIVRKTFEVLFAPDANMIFVSTSSPAIIEAIISHIKFVIFDYLPNKDRHEEKEDDTLNKEQGDFFILNAFTASFVNAGIHNKIFPFCFVDGQESPPIEADDYMCEWLTWMMLSSLDVDHTSRAIEIDKTVRLRYSPRADLKQSQFKARHDNLPIQSVGVEQAANGGLVDDIALYLKDVDVFNIGSSGCDLRINKAGFISNVLAPKLKSSEKTDMLPYVMNGVVTIFKEISKREQAFFKIRKNLRLWTDEIVRLRRLCVKYSKQNLEHELKFCSLNPKQIADLEKN